MKNRDSEFRLVERVLTSTLQEQIKPNVLARRCMTLEELQALCNGYVPPSYKGDGFYRISGNVYKGGEVVRITSTKGGYTLWSPTPISVLKECLDDVTRFIEQDVLYRELPNLLRRKKSDVNFDMNTALDSLDEYAVKGCTLIELGCGDARAALAANVVYGMGAVAIDIDPTMIHISRVNLSKLHALRKASNDDVKLYLADIFDRKVIESTLGPIHEERAILFLYLTRPGTIRAVTSYLPHLRRGDYIVTNRVALQGQLSEDLASRIKTKLEVSKWMGPPINVYKVVG